MPRVGRPINPPHVPTTAQLSQAILVGNTVYCSGQIGVRPDGTMAGSGIEEQAAQAFENLQAVLREVGATLNNVVKTTVYLVDQDDRERFIAVRSRYFEPPFPASTLVVVQKLARPEYRFELDATAVVE
jgi:2-iminobutanoate/2-iminopropanoate deaminase